MIYTEEQIKMYLNKIGYDKSIELNGQTLEQLQIAHLKNIPYENLDILNQIPLSLEAEDLFKKMIINSRGGYCFELNGLYSNLLKSLGFNITNLSGRFARDSNIMLRSHRLIKVNTNDGIYICDVGVRGESPRIALKLIHGLIQNDGISEYKFEADDFYGHTLWQRERGKEWNRIYGFTEEPQLDIDYIMPSFYCEKHPKSLFTDLKKISIFTDTANITIVGDTLKFYENAKVVKEIHLKNKEEVDEALEKYFKIKIGNIII